MCELPTPCQLHQLRTGCSEVFSHGILARTWEFGDHLHLLGAVVGRRVSKRRYISHHPGHVCNVAHVVEPGGDGPGTACVGRGECGDLAANVALWRRHRCGARFLCRTRVPPAVSVQVGQGTSSAQLCACGCRVDGCSVPPQVLQSERNPYEKGTVAV